MNSSALRREASSTIAGSAAGRVAGCHRSGQKGEREVSARSTMRSPCSPTSRNERSTPTDAEALRLSGRHAEDDLRHHPHDRVAFSRRGEAEVLAHGGARARHRPQHDLALRADDELLRDRLVVHGVVVRDRERLARSDRDRSSSRPRSALVSAMAYARGAGRRAPGAAIAAAAPARARAIESRRAVRVVMARYLVSSPFSTKYFFAPGWKGTGEATLDWFASSRFFASEWTATRSAWCSKSAFTRS